jgi:hypothetical protein
MIILRQRTFSEEKEGMSTGKKVALGTLGTAATTGLAFAGAKHGIFGNRAMLQANKAWGTTGAYLSKAGAKNLGSNMMKSGSQGINKAQTGVAMEKLGGKSNYAIQSAGGINALASKSGQNVQRIYENKWNNIINPS